MSALVTVPQRIRKQALVGSATACECCGSDSDGLLSAATSLVCFRNDVSYLRFILWRCFGGLDGLRSDRLSDISRNRLLELLRRRRLFV